MGSLAVLSPCCESSRPSGSEECNPRARTANASSARVVGAVYAANHATPPVPPTRGRVGLQERRERGAAPWASPPEAPEEAEHRAIEAVRLLEEKGVPAGQHLEPGVRDERGKA